jgi:hypothetical protein
MKHFLLFIACLLLGVAAQAQHFVGARGGMGFHQMLFNVSPSPEQAWARGASGGFVFRSMTGKHMGIQLELLAEEKGWHLFPGTPGAYHLQELHATLPIQTVVVLGKGRLQFVITAGAFASYIMGQEVHRDGTNTAYPVDFKQQGLQEWQYGLLGGMGPMFQISKRSRLQLDARYAYTLSNRLEPNLGLDNTFDVSQLQTANVALSWLFRLREMETGKLKYGPDK